MKTILTIVACLALAGCGSFPLGTSYPQKGQTQREVDADILFCKDVGQAAASTTERNIKGGLLRGTLIGAPVAVLTERQVYRDAFAKCMTERGYQVVPPQ